MPISDLSMYAGLSYSLDSVLNALQQTETQLGTGKRVNSPSDDPAAYGTSVVLNAQLSAANNDVKLAQVIQGKLTTASGQLSSASTAIETAIQLGRLRAPTPRPARLRCRPSRSRSAECLTR